MQEDGSMVDTPFAAIAFVHPNGQQYSQINIDASEVEGIEDGASLAFTPADSSHGLDVPEDHREVMMAEK
jgi:hypothetical protein